MTNLRSEIRSNCILQSLRANAQRVYEGIRDLPGLRLRLRPDAQGPTEAKLARWASREYEPAYLGPVARPLPRWLPEFPSEALAKHRSTLRDWFQAHRILQRVDMAVVKAGVPQPVLYRFMTGERDLTLTTAEKLMRYFDLNLRKR